MDNYEIETLDVYSDEEEPVTSRGRQDLSSDSQSSPSPSPSPRAARTPGRSVTFVLSLPPDTPSSSTQTAMQTMARADYVSWFNRAGSTTTIRRKKSSPPGSPANTERPPRLVRLPILAQPHPRVSEMHPRAIKPYPLWSGERRRPVLRVQPSEIITDHGPVASYSSQSSASPTSPPFTRAPTIPAVRRTCSTCSCSAGSPLLSRSWVETREPQKKMMSQSKGT